MIIRHEEVEVFGSPILVVETNEGKFVPPRHICDGLGITSHRQIEKVINDDGLTGTHMLLRSEDGKTRIHAMLPLDKMSGWLFMINPNKVKPEVKPKLLKYRAEAFAYVEYLFPEFNLRPTGVCWSSA